VIVQVDERFDNVFPPHWRVQHCLLMAFLQATRQQILEQLEGRLRPTHRAYAYTTELHVHHCLIVSALYITM
jgi:hypothetical protein